MLRIGDKLVCVHNYYINRVGIHDIKNVSDMPIGLSVGGLYTIVDLFDSGFKVINNLGYTSYFNINQNYLIKLSELRKNKLEQLICTYLIDKEV